MTCEECEELLGAYVLDAATLEERNAVEQHLAGCSRCQQELQEMRAVTNLLPLAVPQIDPPAYMKDRILSAIHETSQANQTAKQGVVRPFRPAIIPASGQGVRSVPQEAREQGGQGGPIPLRERRAAATIVSRRRSPQRSTWYTSLVAAAAVLFLLLSGSLTVWNVSLQHNVSSLQTKVNTLQASSTNAVTLTTYTVKGTNGAPDATGQVYYLPQQHITVLVMHGLPRLANTQVYQGWLIRGKQTTSIGLLNVQPDGTATVNYSGDITGFDAAAVSKEQGPIATPDAPKGPVVALGSLSKS